MPCPHIATFFLSTGRCATQWLAAALAAQPGATVVHEAWQDHLLTRHLRGVADPTTTPHGAALLAHAERIDRALESGPYYETGYPIWTALPWLAERFAGRVRIVHLPRHPVPTALSWLTHGAWQPPLAPHTPPGRVLIEADDPGVIHGEYRAAWPRLSAYDKALFYWAEVHAAGLALEASAAAPWLRLHFEHLFTEDGRTRLADVLGIDPATLRRERVDAWHYLLTIPVRWRDVAHHPAVLRVAEALGYDPFEVDVAALQRRFGPGLIDA